MLETLATYRSLGTSLQWEWRKGWRYSHARYADDYDVRAYERGEYVPVWILRRDPSPAWPSWTGPSRTRAPRVTRHVWRFCSRGATSTYGRRAGWRGCWEAPLSIAGRSIEGGREGHGQPRV